MVKNFENINGDGRVNQEVRELWVFWFFWIRGDSSVYRRDKNTFCMTQPVIKYFTNVK